MTLALITALGVGAATVISDEMLTETHTHGMNVVQPMLCSSAFA